MTCCDLPSVSFEPFRIEIEPYGLTGDVFSFVEPALEIAAMLAKTGHKIRAINQGAERFLDGAKLKAVLDETPVEFENFPR
jgi:hypothetical protein